MSENGSIILTLITALESTVVYALISVLVLHFVKPRAKVRAMTTCLALTIPVDVVLLNSDQHWINSLGISAQAQAAIITCALLGFAIFAYLQLYFVFTSSITISLVVKIFEARESALKISDLSATLSFKNTLRNRIELMIRDLLLINDPTKAGSLVAGSKCRFYGAIFSRLKSFFALGKGG